ncbi:hypothetical protein ACFE04_023900 [Oxalis oulophora]
MMLGVLRRRVSSRGSSYSVLRRSSRVAPNAGKEIVPQHKEFGSFTNFSQFVRRGGSNSSSPLRSTVPSFLTPTTTQTWSRLFSSDSGDSVDAVVPFMGESITDGTLATFLKTKVGDTVEPGTKIAVISLSGEGVDSSGKISEDKSSEPSPPKEPKTEDKPQPQPQPQPDTVSVAEKPKPKAPAPQPAKGSATEPQLPPKERERRVPMTRLRKRVATRLKDSQNTFALLSTFNEVDMTNLMKLRSEYKDDFVEKHGVKLGLMSGFVKSAILGMHSIVSRPMVVGGNIVPRPMMYIALTYDHRLIDGREAVFFLRRIKDVVEDPRRLLLDV